MRELDKNKGARLRGESRRDGAHFSIDPLAEGKKIFSAVVNDNVSLVARHSIFAETKVNFITFRILLTVSIE